MKQKIGLIILILVLITLLSSCYPYVNDRVLKEWPKYVPPQVTQVSFAGIAPPAPGSCAVHAVDLLGAWVAAKTPETDPFPFSDVNGKQCQGLFNADILPLFSQPNLWYAGALSCRTCHGPDVQVSYARLDLSSYQGILAGSGRDSADTKGDDILGGGDWQTSVLHGVLTKGVMPPNQPPDLNPQGPILYAGSSK